MFYTSEIKRNAPLEFATPLQKAIYGKFHELEIPFERIDCDPGITMEDCLNVDRALRAHTVKTLFLCNRQQTKYYLFVTTGAKPFITKVFGAALAIPRVSFASEDKLRSMLGTPHGSSTVLSCCLVPKDLLSGAGDLSLSVILDREVLEADSFCCTDGTATCFVKISVPDLRRFLAAAGVTPTIIDYQPEQ